MMIYSVYLVLLAGSWLDSQNIAALGGDSIGRSSDASVWFSTEQGDWVNYSASDNLIVWGAQTHSLYQMNDKVVMIGEVDYTNLNGYNMSGSVWIDPSDKPFDMVEYNQDRAGRKQLESSHLKGGVGYSINRQWGIGAVVDYTAANYAKRRDLRHQNKLMQLQLVPSVAWQANAHLKMGATYQYRRSVEEVSFNMAGTTDLDYYTLVSYGAFYGIRQLSSKLDGYATTTGGALPLVDTRHRGSFQIDWRWSGSNHWMNQFDIEFRDGYYGRRTTYTIVYTDHDGLNARWMSGLSFTSRNGHRHHLKGEVEYNTLINRENLYNEEQQGGGFTEIVYYSRLARMKRSEWHGRLSYLWQPDALWKVDAGAEFYRHDLRTTFYPYYREQDINQIQLSADVQRIWRLKRGSLSLLAGCGFITGSGQMAEDGLLVTGEVYATTVSADWYLQREYDYLTASQWMGKSQVEYCWIMSRSFRPFVRTDYLHKQSMNARYVPDSYHWTLSLHLGCYF